MDLAQDTEIKEQLESIENVDEVVLANFVSGKINYEFSKSFLVKQLPSKMIEKTIKVPVPTGEKDEDGNDLTEIKEETTEVESIYRTGIILKIPTSLQKIESKEYAIGDKIVYRNLRVADFDYIKDAALVDPFDVICKEV